MKLIRRVYRTRNVKPVNPIIAIGVVLIVIASGVARGFMANEVLILGTYFVGVAAAAIAWYWNLRLKEVLWTVGMLLAAFSAAAMLLTAQFWLAAGAFFFLLLVILYPSARAVRRQTHENVLNRRR